MAIAPRPSSQLNNATGGVDSIIKYVARGVLLRNILKLHDLEVKFCGRSSARRHKKIETPLQINQLVELKYIRVDIPLLIPLDVHNTTLILNSVLLCFCSCHCMRACTSLETHSTDSKRAPSKRRNNPRIIEISPSILNLTMAFQMAMPWHDGEEKMQKLMRSPDMDNPTSSMLTAQGASLLQRAPLIAIGALDSENRPWTTVWGGEPGLSQPLGQSMIGIRTPVDMRHDPVVKFLLGGKVDGETTHEQGQGRMVSGLIIDLMARKRVKLFGRMLAGAVEAVNSERPEINLESSEGQVQLVVRIDQSLGKREVINET